MRPLTARLFLLGASSLLTLALCELGLRVAWQNPYRDEAPDHVLELATQHPQTAHWFDRGSLAGEGSWVELRTDGRSYILPSFQHPEPDLTLVFLGGSTTENSLVREPLRFPALVSQELGRDGWKINTLNAGRSGNTLHDSINVLLNHASLDRPDVAIVMHTANDIGVLSRDPEYRSRMGGPISTSELSKWTAQLLSSRVFLVALARRAALGSVAAAPAPAAQRPAAAARPPLDPAAFHARLKIFVHLCRDLGIEPVLMTQPLSKSTNALTPEWADLGNQERFTQVIREVGQEQQAVVIDLVRYFREQVPGWDEPGKLFYDGMHFTDEGSRIAASFIADQLRPLARKLIAQRRR